MGLEGHRAGLWRAQWGWGGTGPGSGGHSGAGGPPGRALAGTVGLGGRRGRQCRASESGRASWRAVRTVYIGSSRPAPRVQREPSTMLERSRVRPVLHQAPGARRDRARHLRPGPAAEDRRARPGAPCGTCAGSPSSAKADLQEGLGPEFRDFDIADLHPKNFVRKHLWEEFDAERRERHQRDNSGTRSRALPAVARREPRPTTPRPPDRREAAGPGDRRRAGDASAGPGTRQPAEDAPGTPGRAYLQARVRAPQTGVRPSGRPARPRDWPGQALGDLREFPRGGRVGVGEHQRVAVVAGLAQPYVDAGPGRAAGPAPRSSGSARPPRPRRRRSRTRRPARRSAGRAGRTCSRSRRPPAGAAAAPASPPARPPRPRRAAGW